MYIQLPKFQFLYGTIKSEPEPVQTGHQFNFNSSMVRLKVSRKSLFQNVASHFNSSMVRLKDIDPNDNDTYYRISIPLWYD